jgi:hypothetical protein
MLASNQQMMEVLNSLGPVRIIDREPGTVEIEMPIPAVGLSPALSKLLRIAAGNDVVAMPLQTGSSRPDKREHERLGQGSGGCHSYMAVALPRPNAA